MPINSESALIAGLAAGDRFGLFKATQTAEGSGTWHSVWRAIGFPPAGAVPPAFTAASGYVPTRATAGAIPFANPVSPALGYLGRLALAGSATATIIVYDRLWACSGFDTTLITDQSIVTPGVLPIGRDPTNGTDVEPWLEVYTAPGATAATWTLTGVDAAGNTSRTWTYSHPANAESVGQMMPLLPAGATPADTLGCRQATALTCSASSGTAGNVGVTLLRRLAEIPVALANIAAVYDAFALGMPRIYDDACLALQILCAGTNTGTLQGGLTIAKG
jgi:hypothetical protein